MVKTCLSCKSEKALDDFYKFFDKWSNRHYASARCKPCHQEYKKENPVATARNRKNGKLKLRYGLTYEQWEQIRSNEAYSCMICGITESELDRKLDVDHCHASGRARGVLCNACNTMIGRAKDNVAVLRSAAAYLEKNINGYSGGYK